MVAKTESCASEIGTDQKPNVIAQLNDAFRRTCSGGTLVATPGVIALGWGALPAILDAVRSFTAFDSGNDPYSEHDFGAVEWLGNKLFWKIDCYDADLCFGSPDPTDPTVTARVLTIMLAEEY